MNAKNSEAIASDAIDILREYVAFNSETAENRPQQEEMTAAVTLALANNTNLICQAGTGTGKSIAYLAGIYATKRQTVISTATKALGEQLVGSDIPALDEFIRATGKKELSYAILKGRSNYVCRLKIGQIERLGQEEILDSQSPFEFDSDDFVQKESIGSRDPAEMQGYKNLLVWAGETSSGDRTDAPPVSDWSWDQVSTTANACLGSNNCPFAADCFSEHARERAKSVDVAVINHALLAADMKNESPLFGEFDAIVIDEVHELEKSLSSSWGSEFSVNATIKTIKNSSKVAANSEDVKGRAVIALASADGVEVTLKDVPAGKLEVLPPELRKAFHDLHGHVGMLIYELSKLAEGAEGSVKAGRYRAAAKDLESLTETISATLDDGPEVVRWIEARGDISYIKTAPLEVGRRLQAALGNRTLIATSATCAVGGTFDLLTSTLNLQGSFTVNGSGVTHPRAFNTLDVGTPFNWQTAAMLYIPNVDFPEPVGKDRREHTEAVLVELLALASAAGGRTLFLSTTTSGATGAANYLRDRLPVNVYGPGDGTAGQLSNWFISDETSVLCATMGMWAGLNPAGPTCSLVVIDKIPFPPMDDPLTNARSEAADARGGNGFMEISVGHAGLMLAQGAGRLIRSSTDKGVIAILDRRLHTKRYGKILIRSLPVITEFTQREQVEAALTRLTGGLKDLEITPKREYRAVKDQDTVTKRANPKNSAKGRSISSGRNPSWGKSAKSPVTNTRKRNQNEIAKND